MPITLSTLSATEEKLEKLEQQAATSTTPASASQSTQPENTNTQKIEEKPDTSEFSISLGEENAEEEKKSSQNGNGNGHQFDWKEEFKKIDPKEVIKELGLTDFALEINEHLKRGGKAEDYFFAKAIDYNKMGDEDLIKDDLRKQFPNFSYEQINRLYNKKYGTNDEMTESEIEDRKLELQADAHIKRQQKITEQQKFQFPQPITPKDEGYENWKQEQEQQKQTIDQLKNYFTANEATKNLHESKRVTVNVGKDIPPFNFAIDKPELITQTLTDDGTNWRKLTNTETGEPDVAKQQLLTLFAFNPQKFVQDIFNYGVSYGKLKLVGEGQNAQKPTTPAGAAEPNGKPTISLGKYADRQRT